MRLIFERQWLHVVLLAILLAGLTVAGGVDKIEIGALSGIGSTAWFRLAVAIAVAHQVYVWLCWRTELHGASLTRMLGARAFPVYATGFSILGLSRIGAVFALAVSNRGTVPADPAVLRVLAVLALCPAAYLCYSVQRYFTFKRAFGIDHFDGRYRGLPLVRQGIFRFTPNSMYTYGFLLLWVPALWCASFAALCVALFNHLYIWVHYYATELPDMRHIYGNAPGTADRKSG